MLCGAVFAAVYHAEIIAHRTGEPYGTLVLTIAVTVIEVALIISVMLSGDGNPTLARDTVYAVVMIICTGLVGLRILIGGLHHGEQGFRVTGASAYLTLVLPNYTSTIPGPVYSASQLAFVSTVTLALYGVFLYIQTVRHRDHFIELRSGEKVGEMDHLPSDRDVSFSFILLLLALTGVILLAKKFAAVVEAGTSAIGAPEAVVGVIVALLILLPEGLAAVQAARQDELQKSLNLALGSSLATIGNDGSGCCRHVHDPWSEPCSWPRRQVDSASRHDTPHLRADFRNRTHQHSLWLCPSCRFWHIPLPDICAIAQCARS